MESFPHWILSSLTTTLQGRAAEYLFVKIPTVYIACHKPSSHMHARVQITFSFLPVSLSFILSYITHQLPYLLHSPNLDEVTLTSNATPTLLLSRRYNHLFHLLYKLAVEFFSFSFALDTTAIIIELLFVSR